VLLARFTVRIRRKKQSEKILKKKKSVVWPEKGESLKLWRSRVVIRE
jgi:hypothetical protein